MERTRRWMSATQSSSSWLEKKKRGRLVASFSAFSSGLPTVYVFLNQICQPLGLRPLVLPKLALVKIQITSPYNCQPCWWLPLWTLLWFHGERFDFIKDFRRDIFPKMCFFIGSSVLLVGLAIFKIWSDTCLNRCTNSNRIQV